MKTVIESLRRKRDMTLLFVFLGLPLAISSGIVFGDQVMWLGIVIVTIAVIYLLRIKCPYCGHLVQMKKGRTGYWRAYSSPAIWDYCPNCHHDLTVPFDRNRPSTGRAAMAAGQPETGEGRSGTSSGPISPKKNRPVISYR